VGAAGWDFETTQDRPHRQGERHGRPAGGAHRQRRRDGSGSGSVPRRPADAPPDLDAAVTAVLPAVTATTEVPPTAARAGAEPVTTVFDRLTFRGARRRETTAAGPAPAATPPAGTSSPGTAPPGTAPRTAPPGTTVHQRVQAGAEFAELRRRQRRFVFPVTAAFLLWYLAYVLLACYARDLMAVRVADGVNLGLVIGLLQFVSTFVISTVYVVYARDRLDPLAAQLRARVEAEDALEVAGPAPDHLFGGAGSVGGTP
jgi:uncharacterized membrane protein (DUF485 family)